VILTLPYQFELRDYQRPLWQAMFVHKKRHLLALWHRRAGKTKTIINLIVAAAHIKVGAYYHLYPQAVQARRVVWRGRGADGVHFLEHFPRELLAKDPNNADMFIEFKNGSTYQLLGSDYYDTLRGGNPLGIVYDEYSIQNPSARDFLNPILIENKGWELFPYTPHGTNHGYSLYEAAKDNADWFCEKLTINESRLPSGEMVVDPKEIDVFRRSGWTEDRIQQEFYCSFTAAVPGALLAKQLAQTEKDKRIYDFPIRSDVAVDTYWDIGNLDATAIWFAQQTHEGIKIINYYECNLADMNHYINYVHDFRDKHNLTMRWHWAPHDADHHRLSVGGNKSLVEQCRALGFNFRVLPRILKKIRAIQPAQQLFSRLTFHKTNCKRGLDCLREYHLAYNDAMQCYSDQPAHNWASHGADAFLYMAQAIGTEQDKIGRNTVVKGAFRSSIFD